MKNQSLLLRARAQVSKSLRDLDTYLLEITNWEKIYCYYDLSENRITS